MKHASSRLNKTALLLFFMALLLASIATTTRGQSALDGFDPNANGIVRVVVVQPDGKILLGGEFTSLSPNGGSPVTRNHIVRLNPNGSLDVFDPNANDVVSVIVVQPDGKILIGGSFTTLSPNGGGPVTRNRIARLNPDGSLDTNFNPNASAVISAIAVQADGKILAGGSFTSIGGQTRNGIARLDPLTGAADLFDPNASGGFPPTSVYTIAVQSDGRILAGGSFTSIGGQIRNRIARLDPTTGLADSFNPSPNGFTGVEEIIVQPDGKILVGGGFSTIGGQTRNNIARLDASTDAADSFNPNAENTVLAMALQEDGKVLIGGHFASVGGVTTFMARLDPITGAPEATFNHGSNERVFSIALQSDGKILAGGNFTSMSGGHPRNRIARLESDGSLDQTLDFNIIGDGAGAVIHAIAVQPDGKILVGGNFISIAGESRQYIARLSRNGGIDAAFNPNPNFGAIVRAIAVQADGMILVGGSFGNIGGQPRNSIARLDATTGLADSFNPTAVGSEVETILVQPDGKVLAGGIFTSIGGAPRNRIARLVAATGLADSFNPNANSNVVSIALQADGKVLAGGDFNGANSIGGAARNRIARLNTDGTADSFNPNANGTVYSMAVQADGKILAGGQFTSMGGESRSNIARLNMEGTADSFDPNANGTVYSITMQGGGKILVGGEFSSIGGQIRGRGARLNNDTAALQNLTATKTTSSGTVVAQAPKVRVLHLSIPLTM